jgi:multisubunit Na+/H+ antiporter MnhF subunit/uncharacterized MnhB-related membrane protein
VAKLQTRMLQSGYLRYYLMIILVFLIGTAGFALITRVDPIHVTVRWHDLHLFEIALVAVMIVATVATISARTQLGAVAYLGVIGSCVALIFIIYGAPDLAMTQLVIEILMVVLLVLILHKLPAYGELSTRLSRGRDFVIALAGGLLMTDIDIFQVVVNGVLLTLVLAFILAFIRLLMGPTLPNRVVALDLIATLVVAILAVYAISTNQPIYLRPAIVVALITFLGTIGFAYYVEKRGTP